MHQVLQHSKKHGLNGFCGPFCGPFWQDERVGSKTARDWLPAVGQDVDLGAGGPVHAVHCPTVAQWLAKGLFRNLGQGPSQGNMDLVQLPTGLLVKTVLRLDSCPFSPFPFFVYAYRVLHCPNTYLLPQRTRLTTTPQPLIPSKRQCCAGHLDHPPPTTKHTRPRRLPEISILVTLTPRSVASIKSHPPEGSDPWWLARHTTPSASRTPPSIAVATPIEVPEGQTCDAAPLLLQPAPRRPRLAGTRLARQLEPRRRHQRNRLPPEHLVVAQALPRAGRPPRQRQPRGQRSCRLPQPLVLGRLRL